MLSIISILLKGKKYILLFVFFISNYSVSQVYQVTSEERESFMSGGRFGVKTVNGEMVGYVVIQSVPGSLFERVGFQKGDVVTKINGYEVSDAKNVRNFHLSLRNATAIEVEVNRFSSLEPVFLKAYFDIVEK